MYRAPHCNAGAKFIVNRIFTLSRHPFHQVSMAVTRREFRQNPINADISARVSFTILNFKRRLTRACQTLQSTHHPFLPDEKVQNRRFYYCRCNENNKIDAR